MSDDTIQKIADEMLAAANGPTHIGAVQLTAGFLKEWATRLRALSARASAGEGGRERDREMFSDAGFNRWLDEYVSDTGHTVYDYIGGHEMIAAAWGGWDAYRYYHSHAPQPAQAGAGGGGDGRLTACIEGIALAKMALMAGDPVKAHERLNAISDKLDTFTTPASPATGATLGVEGQMRLVAELANDMDEAHRAEQCTEFAKRLRAIFAPNWQTGAAHPQQAPAQETEESRAPGNQAHCPKCDYFYPKDGVCMCYAGRSDTTPPAHGDGEVRIGSTRCYGDDEWFRELTVQGVTFLAPLDDQDRARHILARPAPEADARDGRPTVRELIDVLPGVYYMDPPDGGSVSLLEQLQRMAQDAARYRFLKFGGYEHADDGHPYIVVHRQDGYGNWNDTIIEDADADARIDAAMSLPAQGRE